MEEEKKWSLDYKIPLQTIIVIIIYVASMGYMYAETSADIAYLKQEQAKQEIKLKEFDVSGRGVLDRLIRLEEKVQGQTFLLQRILNIVEKEK